MANIYWKGEKEDFKKAKLALMGEVVEIYEGNFDVYSTRDDNGSCLELVIETESPSTPLERQEPRLAEWKKEYSIWMGWRFLLIMVPVGYIGAVINRTRREAS